MAKDDAKLIADQAKEIASLKTRLSAKEARQTRDMAEQVDWAKELLDIQSRYADGKEEVRKASDRIKDIDKQIAEYQQFAVDYGKEYTKEEKKVLGLKIKELKEIRSIEKSLEKQALSSAKIAKIEAKALPHRKQLNDAQEKLNNTYDKYNHEIKSSLGFIGDIANSIEEIPIVGGILSKALGLEELQDEVGEKLTAVFSKTLNPEAAKQVDASKQALENYDAQINALQEGGEATIELAEESENVAGGIEGAQVASKGLLASLGPVLLAAGAIYGVFKLFEKALHLDQELTDMARGFGMSKEAAYETHHHLLDIAKTTKVVGASSKALVEAYEDLANNTGINAVNNKDMLESQILLTKQYGMAGNEAAAFQQTAAGSNVTTEQLMGTVSQMTEEYNKITGSSLNQKAIAKDIAKVSKTISAAYKGDVKALTKAALQAKSMGMSLEQTAAVADKLLDVESSIEAEMKANVLTGKSMNMNAARQLAFQGDSAGAAAEALKQAGSYDDFLKMNVVQQKAVAEAAGMTVEELTNAGQVQKINEQLSGKQIKNLSELSAEERNRLVASGDISEEAAKKLALDEQQASTQEKIASIVDRISAAFDYMMAGPIGGIMEAMSWIADKWDYIYPVVLGVGTALAVTMLPTLWTMVTAASAWAVEMAVAAISAIATASAATLGLGVAGIAAGIAVGAVALSSAHGDAEKVDDAMIDPDGGLVVKGKKGTFQLNEGDSIVAGTELGNSSDGGAGGGEANGNQLASIKQLSKDVKGIDWKDLLELEFKFMMISDAFEELDVDQITKFSELADKDLKGAGEKLAAGVNGLIGFDRNISWTDLWSLEDSFDDIEDVFAELDVEALTAFAKLADADMALAGENLANGVNGLIGWDKNVKWSELWSLEESFDLIEDMFDELDMEQLVQFGSLADKDLGALGDTLGSMFNSFAEFGTDETLDALDMAEDVFDYLEDALDELDYEQLAEFGNADFSKMEENAKHLFAGINELSKLSSLDLNGLENTFDLLEDAMDELDMDELADFLELDTTKLANIVNSALGGGGEGGAAGKDPNAKIVSLLEQLIAKVDQPVNIKLGSRTIEEIGTQIGLRKSYSSRVDSGYGNV